MPSESVMKKMILRTLLVLALISAAYTGISMSMQEASEPVTEPAQAKKTYEPAGKFVPTEKLRADDAVAFPVDI